MSKKLKSLDALDIPNSGFDQIDEELDREKHFVEFMAYLVAGEYEALDNLFMERADLISSNKIKALKILNILAQKKELTETMIFPIKRNEILADGLAYELIEVYEEVVSRAGDFPKIDFYELQDLLPSIVIYYSDFILKQKLEDKYDEVFAKINDKSNFESLVDEQWVCQQDRLLALYYRRKGENEKAEQSLSTYRERFKFDPQKPIKIKTITPDLDYKVEEVFDHWSQIMDDCSKIQKEVGERAGIYEDTCFYFSCDDCCTKDYPVMSLSEYEYFKQWCKDIMWIWKNLK